MSNDVHHSFLVSKLSPSFFTPQQDVRNSSFGKNNSDSSHKGPSRTNSPNPEIEVPQEEEDDQCETLNHPGMNA